MKTTTVFISFVTSVALCATLQAVPLLSTGFEAPEYVPGDLVGQNGWDAIGFFEDDIVNVNVQTAVVRSGAQAVSLSGSGEGAGAFAYNVTPYTPAADKLITIDFDMQWGTSGNTRSYLYGVQAYDTELNQIGSVGVAQAFGVYNAVVFDADGTAITIPGAVVTAGEWNHFQLLLDYESQTYRALVDGFASPAIPFQTAGIVDFGETDLFRDAGLGNANDTAYFDNLSTVTSVVPEPASIGIGGGLASLLLRRRN
jgi:hypothetical protein